ncbi:diphthine--ammonia ligase family protein [Aspergillus melleus]|uniref:diphthine--ammonia ligase family protein n=1 Tax=Aspergillus melleus TaxID=138277 RepID=UPI001E8E048C|nr:uncharacterized protein LDX57_006187 [Aspergillus melleus]KAH8428488.1 hypothetical protein LDX57_006187 [Aspergillus melleus]
MSSSIPTSTSTPQTAVSTPSLNVIALISGGKDSLYSILHCLRNGHNVVALGNLHPAPKQQHKTATGDGRNDNNGVAQAEGPERVEDEEEEEEEDDIDSFMYQTIGHNVIPLYESALGIPLYRAPITGGAVDTARVYREDAVDQMADDGGRDQGLGRGSGSGSGDGDRDDEGEDETESLIPLLRRIKLAHPEANAVSAGAILSTYQRTRIENVAARLGLVPLAWLWQYPSLPAPVERAELSAMMPDVADAGLLEDMAAVGCEARVIKVASGGLDEGFLWGDLSSGDGAVRRRIAKGMKRFAEAEDIRGAVLGEGGEYESLALDGPGFLWKQRIEIQQREVRSGDGGVGFMRLKGARCVDKEQEDVKPEDVRRPALLDEAFAAALDALSAESSLASTMEMAEQTETGPWECPGVSQSTNGGTWTVSNVTAPEAGPGAAEQMRAIAQKIRDILGSTVHDSGSDARTTADIVFTTVLLRSMADFPSMNDIYVSLFKKPNPPARATIACGDSLPEGVKVMVSLVVDLGSRDLRQGLHVQSRSYWAPANIGPYSQAMSIPWQGAERLVYIAGQIPLEPASMELPIASPGPESSWFETYALRAVLSLQHLWRIGSANQVDWWLGTVTFLSGTDAIDKKAAVAWHLWEIMHSRHAEEDEEDEEPALDAWDIKYGGRAHEQQSPAGTTTLPNFSVVQSDVLIPAFFAVQVEELPRGSDIEWQGLGYRCDEINLATEDTALGRRIDASTKEGMRYTAIEIDMDQSGPSLESSLRGFLEMYSERPGNIHSVVYTAQPLRSGVWSGQVIPCKSVWGRQGRRLAAGILIQKS